MNALSKKFTTTLSLALKSAGAVFVDGYEVDTQIDGSKIGKPGQFMLSCNDEYTVFLADQEIEVDDSGTAMIPLIYASPETAKVAVTFLVTVPLLKDFLLKTEGVPA